ncbi:MAG: YtxH domain-containing protein [Elusimicrobiota bacterium]|jgi:gas vesicle protein|nr:YtxH domain-containing protein [Elusimicrobiota bacterium]
MSDKNNSLLVFVVGAVIGAAVGLLYAPKTGRETREDLRRLGEDLSDTVADFSGDLKEKTRKIYNEGRERVLSSKDKITEVFEEGKRAFDKYKDED